MHTSLKIIKTLLYSYSTLHVSGTLAPIIRSLLILHIQPPVKYRLKHTVCFQIMWRCATVYSLYSFLIKICYLLHGAESFLRSQPVNFAASQEIPCIYGTRKFLTVPTSARHLSLSWANSIQSPRPPSTPWRSILILSSHRNEKVVTYLVDGICAKNSFSGGVMPQFCVLNGILNRQVICDVALRMPQTWSGQYAFTCSSV
jgi:hypothetical protein